MIETQRFILRKFTIFDAEAMFKNWASDEDVTKYQFQCRSGHDPFYLQFRRRIQRHLRRRIIAIREYGLEMAKYVEI